MMATSNFIPAYLLIAITLLQSCFAQLNDNTPWCPITAPTYNSSGQTGFQMTSEEDWYISLAVNDRGGISYSSTTTYYISHPELTSVTMGCFYRFKGINATATGTGDNGCEGVLSAECMDVLREISFPPVTSGVSMDDMECEDIDTDRIPGACPIEILAPIIVRSPVLGFSNQTCDDKPPPGEHVPERYHTRLMGTYGIKYDQRDRDAGSFESYDVSVKRPVPSVFAAHLADGTTETHVVCVAPDHVAEGSREPEEEEPWDLLESTGARRSRVIAGQVATVVAIAVVVAGY